MKERARLTFAVVLIASLVGAFATTRAVGPPDQAPPTDDGAVASGGRLLAPEVAALRNAPGGSAERWLQQSTSSKGRSLSLAATLAVALGALSVVPRRHGRRPRLCSSPLSLRRHSAALRAPPSIQLA